MGSRPERNDQRREMRSINWFGLFWDWEKGKSRDRPFSELNKIESQISSRFGTLFSGFIKSRLEQLFDRQQCRFGIITLR